MIAEEGFAALRRRSTEQPAMSLVPDLDSESDLESEPEEARITTNVYEYLRALKHMPLSLRKHGRRSTITPREVADELAGHLKDGQTIRTQEQLAADLNVTTRTIERCIKELKEAGWLKVEKRLTPFSCHPMNIYYLSIPHRIQDRTAESAEESKEQS